ncbi:MAG TPA: GspH/FimT family pseudopilin [Pseudomonadales bacterium]|nr:GspH/FimT family pseudopilin [Pseudomonadales bacterium]
MRLCKAQGFTLIEMLITVTILAIILNIGVPSFNNMFKRARSDADTERIAQTIRFARAYAIAQNAEITTCFSDDLYSCDRRAHKAIMVFKDKNLNRKADPGETVEFANLDDGDAQVLFNMSVGRHYIRHRPNGTVKEFGHITYCPGHTDVAYATRLIISRMGRARDAKDEDGDGIVNAVDGENVVC